jgi:POT family proton-dependent oligopeptide transporter
MATTSPPRSDAQPAPLSPEGYRTAPDQESTAFPPGVPYIVGNEVCERFSFYGMRAILQIHLVSLFVATMAVHQEAVSQGGGLFYLTYFKAAAERSATGVTHLFFAGVYALSMIGAILADRLAGKYRTILWLSLVYCAGQAALSAGAASLTGMYIGLILVAIGSGGIKPCVSANVGDQFGKANWGRMRTVFQIFYFSINFGSFFAALLIPAVERRWGAAVAFAIPGVLMFIATVIFWMGRRKFVHVPPKPGGKVGLLDVLSSVSLFLTVGHFFFSPGLLHGLAAWQRTLLELLLSAGFLALGLALFAWRLKLQPDDGFLAITLFALGRWFSRGRQAAAAGEADSPLARSRFWGPAVSRFGLEATEGPVAVFKIMSVFFLVSIFWALFDQKASTWVLQAQKTDRTLWGGVTIEAAQTLLVNPFLVMVLIPFMNVVYRGIERLGLSPTPLRRMTIGMLLTALSFAAVALIQAEIDRRGEGKVWIVWQLIPYVLLTFGEVMVSVTGLEFAYSQSPRRMKSTVMGFWLLTVAAGNVLVTFMAGFKKLEPVTFFWIFAGLMAGAAVLFGLRAAFYVPREYTQG